MLAGAFALIFAAPDLDSRWLEAGWVLVFFVLAASAYAFFQVPYVAMPAEITASYDERTRLMTWRVAILAFTIMLAGATAPVIRDAVGGRDGYRVMGLVMAAIILVGVVSAYADAASTKNTRTHPASSQRLSRSGAAKMRANAPASISPARISQGRRGPAGSTVRSLTRPATGLSRTSHAFGRKTITPAQRAAMPSSSVR